jgi:SAM-dependent methyltransferase
MKKLLKKINSYKLYLQNLKELKKQKANDVTFVFGKKRRFLKDRFQESGTMSGHYFHQDLYVARKIFQHKPIRHVDIGSRTDGFVAHVAVFREIEIFDIREQTKKVKNIIFKKADLTRLPDNLINYCDSISSLHAIEHFGLGRYNDPVDYYGYLKAIDNIARILGPGGIFYFSVPIGKQRIEFNAHRVFSVAYLLELLDKNFTIKSFSYVNDAGDFFEEVALTKDEIERNFGCWYGCGIFELIKSK